MPDEVSIDEIHAARWLTPEPLGGDVTNPQSLNRYAYPLNNPTTLTDPSGLWSLPGCGSFIVCPGGGCDPWDITCNPFPPLPPVILPPIILGGGAGGGSRGGGTASSPPPAAPPATSGACNGDPTGCTSGPNLLTIGIASGGAIAALAAALAEAGQPPQTLPSSLNACEQENLNAVNNRFGTGLTASNVEGGFQFSKFAPSGLGTLNLDISVPRQYQSYGISPGRYPVNWWTYIIGVGPTLHIPSGPGGLESPLTLFFSSSQFTEHLDSAFLYNPIGALLHLLEDLLGIGGYPPCP